jgi:hypothetical protein
VSIATWQNELRCPVRASATSDFGEFARSLKISDVLDTLELKSTFDRARGHTGSMTILESLRPELPQIRILEDSSSKVFASRIDDALIE